MQFTVGAQAHDNFRRLQALLRREIPDGDPGAIVERALALLLEKVEKTKIAAATRPRPSAIRPGTDNRADGDRAPAPAATRTTRYIPREVKRAVWSRDAGQCAFQAAVGRRCSERAFLEFHHVQPYARQGPPTVANISLRCRRHNQYEADLVFGPRSGAGARGDTS
jgi:hypothetical protein